MTLTIDGRLAHQPAAAQALSSWIRFRPELEGVVVFESDGETAWSAWDSAVAKLDGIVGAHEPGRAATT